MEKSVIPTLHVKWSSLTLGRIRLVINDSINNKAKPKKNYQRSISDMLKENRK